mmetsp:Transcript_65021/g.149188  ORF Transcript_65021/g.149188 Transcript_65021/m.149188 type:complete len:371 (+) Transcript_65021:41-1153(+)
MRDKAGRERGWCTICEAECPEFRYSDVQPGADEWECGTRGLLPFVRRSLSMPIGDPVPSDTCEECGCGPETHEDLTDHLDEEQQRAVDATRRLYLNIPLSHVVSQSCNDSMAMDMNRDELTYGEVNLVAFVRLLSQLRERLGTPRPRFYDLGSGAGRSVVLAAMMGFRATGWELLEGVHTIGATLANRAESALATEVKENAEFRHGNLLDADLRDAEAVMISTLCFGDLLMAKILCHLARQLPVGCKVLTLKKALPQSPLFEVKEKFKMAMTWGCCEVLLSERTSTLALEPTVDRGPRVQTRWRHVTAVATGPRAAEIATGAHPAAVEAAPGVVRLATLGSSFLIYVPGVDPETLVVKSSSRAKKLRLQW